MKKYVWCTLQLEGMHNWKNCNLDDVMFLKNPHRHMFHFKCVKEVFHDDRDIEFIQFQRWILSLYSQGTLQNDFKSCEMMSDDLYIQIAKKYPGRKIEIDVSEDGENGSHAVYERNNI
jgi:hypothetical protein